MLIMAVKQTKVGGSSSDNSQVRRELHLQSLDYWSALFVQGAAKYIHLLRREEMLVNQLLN